MTFGKKKDRVGRKLKFVLSDLHIGAGYCSDGRNPLEDFAADDELVNFLHEILQESIKERCEIELIINGDLFEFLQVPAVYDYDPDKDYPLEAYLDSSQAASIKRLNIIVEGHPEVFNALSDFIHVEFPQRRITIIKGNHDVNLFWPGVKSRLREILGASGTRASLLLFADEFVSREKIYVEHGHQRTGRINHYQDFFDPRSSDDPKQLHYPAGSHFVITVFNYIERKHWFVDHIKPITMLIWFAFHWNFDLASQMLTHFLSQTSASGVDALFQDLADDDKRRGLAERYSNEPSFRQRFHRQLQPYLNMAQPGNQETPFHSSASDNALEMGQADHHRQQAMLRQAAELVTQQEGARVVLFGHTHYPTQKSLNNGSVYINTGSWIEDFSNASPDTWETLFDGTRPFNKETIALPYARIEYVDQDKPMAKLMYFNKSAGHLETVFKKWLTRMARSSRQK